MLTDLLVALIAFVPGTLAWWRGRRLARFLDDPALPEILMAGQHHVVGAFATALALMIVFGGTRAAWGFPLLALVHAAGSYPLRRKLLGESAGLFTYLWRSAKSRLGAWGFWFLLLLTPMIVLKIDTRWWPVLAVLIAVLLVWEHLYLRFWLRMHDAAPLTDPVLAPRIQSINERAGIAPPELFQIGAPGTRFVNALALPALHKPAIALGNALFDVLEPDEVAAIYAHELSHIEQFSPRVLRHYQLVNRLLIVSAVGMPLVAKMLVPNTAHWLIMIWPVLMLSTMLLRVRKSQLRETESDLRAAALCGDPETVARALIKLHVHAFIPRRWPVDLERQASHPSLARRIQALRGEGERAVATAGEPTVLNTDREGSFVVFEDARAWWFDGVPEGTALQLESLRATASSVRSVAWHELIELRVTVKGADRALRTVHRNGDSWTVPLNQAHVAAVQKALDAVDVRLQKELGKRALPKTTLIAAAIFLVAMLTGQFAMLIVPMILALVRPSTAALAALGTMAVGSALLAAVLGESTGLMERPEIGLAIIGALGVLALVIAWNHLRGTAKRDGIRLTVLVLGGVAAIMAVSIALAAVSLPASDLIELRLIPALALTLLGVSTVLMISQSRVAKRAGIAVAAAALLTASPALIAANVLGGEAAFTHSVAQAIETSRTSFAGFASGLRLAPGGSTFLVQQFEAQPSNRAQLADQSRYIIGGADNGHREIIGVRAEFLDDHHVFVLRTKNDAQELSLENGDSGEALWTTAIPGLYEPSLVVWQEERSWAIIGTEAATDSLLVITGTTASPENRSRRFELMETESAMEYLIFDHGERLIMPVYDVASPLPSLTLPLMMLSAYSPSMSLVEITTRERRKVGQIRGFPQCGQPVQNRALCIVRDGRRVRIWQVSSTGEAKLLTRLNSDAIIGTAGPGARLTLTNGLDRITDVDPFIGKVTDVQLPEGSGPAYEARSSGDRLAVLRRTDDGTQVVFFRMQPR